MSEDRNVNGRKTGKPKDPGCSAGATPWATEIALEKKLQVFAGIREILNRLERKMRAVR